MTEWKIAKKNRWGHRWIEEPVEREEFRRKCKHLDPFGGCEKGYGCHETHNRKRVVDTFVVGCTPSVEDCERLRRWDKRHGLRPPYTIVDRDGDYLRRNHIVRQQ